MIKLTPVNLSKSINGMTFEEYYLEAVEDVLKKQLESIYEKENEEKKIYGKLKIDSRNSWCDCYYKQLEKLLISLVNKVLSNKKISSLPEFFLLNYLEIKAIYKYINRNKEKYTKILAENEICISALLGSYDRLRDYSSMSKYNKEKNKFSYKLVEAMEIVVCPYCNRNYVNVSSDGKNAFIGAQLDHFIPKQEYPIFALSVNNFVPSCGKCNQYKGKKIISCSPYDQSECVNRPKVIIDLIQPEGFRIDPGNFKDQFDILKLGAAYKIHKQDYKELETRARVYNESQIEEIEELLGLKYQGISYDDFIFGKQYSEMEDHKHPLSKFNRDIVNELKEIISRSR